ANRTAVSGAQAIENLTQGLERLHVGRNRAAGRLDRASEKGPVQIPNREPVGSRIEDRMIDRVAAERIGVREQMAAYAIGADKPYHGGFLGDVRIHLR